MNACRKQFASSSHLIIAVSLSAVLSACAPVDVTEESAVRELEVVDLVEKPAFPLDAHLESADIVAGKYSFDELFDAGGDLFHTAYNGLDGVGVHKLPNGTPVNRFSMVPLGVFPLATSAQSCGSCHDTPVAAAAGLSHTNTVTDPGTDGVGPFNPRNTISVFGNGLLQLLAQEITEDLQAIRDTAAEEAIQSPGTAITAALESKGVSYGEITATADEAGEVAFDLSALEGIDPDLAIRPFAWKGVVPTVRFFSFAASSIAMGMQAEEFVWRLPGGEETPDYDGDGVTRELSVGDVTAITVYSAAQETPSELAALAAAGWVEAPTAEQEATIERGRAAFTEIGCASCHVPELELENTVFEEPTMRGNGHFIDHFLVGKDPNYDPQRPLSFDLLTAAEQPRVEQLEGGGAIVRLYGDLKRHAMGRRLAEAAGPSPSLTPMLLPLMHQDEVVLVAPEVFLTAELWGVGNTGPWLHDGRAGSLREAIEMHGEDEPVAAGELGRSEAQESRDAFLALEESAQGDVLAFLLSLRTFALSD